VLRVSLACKVFLDHPQNYRVYWRGSHPSPVRVSDKQNIQKQKVKTNLRKLELDKLDYIDFEDDQKLVDAKRKTKRKLKITQKAIKDRILITCSPAMALEKGAC
jgi:hypothetical protein